jgi:hypothetical protein
MSPSKTKAPAMKNAQWLPVHFATHVEKSVKKVWILRSSFRSAIEPSSVANRARDLCVATQQPGVGGNLRAAPGYESQPLQQLTARR